MATPGLAPRQAAVRILDGVINDGLLLHEITPKAVSRLPSEDRARAARLAISTLRWMDRADRLLGPFLQKKPPTTVLNTLRLGVVEICHDGAAGHGVVNVAVTIVRGDKDFNRMSGMVNAVLRKVAALPEDDWKKLPQPQMPKWLRKPLWADYGKLVVPAIERAHAAGAPLDITVKADPAEWAEKLGGRLLPTGSIRLDNAPQVTEMPGFETGDWWVQDAAAAMPARILNPQSGEKVLDLCAAPGGKTMQLAAAGAKVTAVDVSEKRMVRVQENLDRTGLAAEIVVSDAMEFTTGGFDAILLDAPCSATGTIRRHPDLPYAKDGSEFPKLFALQEALIDHAWGLLKPGGRMMFCTCSLLIDEGEEQVKDALTRHKDMQVEIDPSVHSEWLDTAWINEHGIRTRPDFWPDHGGMDGFFMTLLRKVA